MRGARGVDDSLDHTAGGREGRTLSRARLRCHDVTLVCILYFRSAFVGFRVLLSLVWVGKTRRDCVDDLSSSPLTSSLSTLSL